MSNANTYNAIELCVGCPSVTALSSRATRNVTVIVCRWRTDDAIRRAPCIGHRYHRYCVFGRRAGLTVAISVLQHASSQSPQLNTVTGLRGLSFCMSINEWMNNWMYSCNGEWMDRWVSAALIVFERIGKLSISGIWFMIIYSTLFTKHNGST